ncbi:MAG: hypothetical protein ABSA33_03530, partial [Candidatus Micrarchaeaceae archaeon]
KSLVGVAVLIVIIGAVAFFGINHVISKKQTNTTTIQGSANPNSSKTLFASSQYARYSYQVYPGPISQQAQAALSGFSLNSTALQNGSTGVKISIVGSSQSQTLVLKPNYKLYIVETSFGDDASHFDASLGDDGFIIVDTNGYIT